MKISEASRFRIPRISRDGQKGKCWNSIGQVLSSMQRDNRIGIALLDTERDRHSPPFQVVNIGSEGLSKAGEWNVAGWRGCTTVFGATAAAGNLAGLTPTSSSWPKPQNSGGFWWSDGHRMRRSSCSSSGLGTGGGGGDFVSWALWLARRRSLPIRLFVVPFFSQVVE